EPEPEPAQESVAETADNNERKPTEGAQLSDEELRKLIPERFTNKYSIKIKLQAVEKNKAANPILRFDATVIGLSRYRQREYKDIR
ncbi:hypothetical protein M1699_23715, partial [Salmonella enterica subsp. enterica serovar Albany]|nr:hypothetical protein [Salmonella enterica subsp. enterica serovar Albany]